MAPHSSTLAWKMPWTEEPGGLQSMGVAKSPTRLRDFTFIFHFHAFNEEMATHSSILAWRIPGMGEPGGLPSTGSHRVRHDWSDLAAAAAETEGVDRVGRTELNPPHWFTNLRNYTVIQQSLTHLILWGFSVKGRIGSVTRPTALLLIQQQTFQKWIFPLPVRTHLF